MYKLPCVEAHDLNTSSFDELMGYFSKHRWEVLHSRNSEQEPTKFARLHCLDCNAEVVMFFSDKWGLKKRAAKIA